MLPHTATNLQTLLATGVLAMVRIGGMIAFAPVFGNAGVPPRVKVVFTLALSVLIAPAAAALPQAAHELTALALLAEAVLGCVYGVALSFLAESLLFAGALMSGSFSFSLANLLDPNSRVETDVLSTALNWLGVLVLLGAGLHRVVLAALLRSFSVLPAGTLWVHAANGQVGRALAEAAGGILLAGLQLAAPVLSAAFAVEITVGLVSRMAPGLPAQMASVPLKSLVSYVTLVGSLALWPAWIERHFLALLDTAERLVRG